MMGNKDHCVQPNNSNPIHGECVLRILGEDKIQPFYFTLKRLLILMNISRVKAKELSPASRIHAVSSISRLVN